MTSQPDWTSDDGWILMAVDMTHGDDGVLLTDVIGAADATMRTPPPTSELTDSLTECAQCDIVRRVDDRFVITEKYLPQIAAAYQSRGGLFQAPAKGKRWLSATEFAVDEDQEIVIGAKEFRVASRKYSSRAWRSVSKRKRK